MRRAVMAAVIALGASVALPRDARAQGWAAWHGCWRGAGAEAGEMVCVLPGGDATSARLVSVSDGEIEHETVVRADNVARTVSEGGCEGTERAFFSADRRRVFTRSEFACGGIPRVATGVLALITEQEWLDAQAITVGDQHAGRTTRYRAVRRADVPAAIVAQLPVDQELAQESARIHATAPLDVDAVVEAARVLAPPAVEALLAARNHGFDLNAGNLIELKEQGVAASTIDVMVALSYPQRFAVRERPRYSETDAFEARRDTWYSCYDPFWGSRRLGRYNSCYGDYGMYGYGYDRYGYNDPIIIVETRAPDTGGSVTRAGYTRGSSPATDRAMPRGGSDAGGSSTTTSSGSGSSTSTGRTAKPRGGGGS